MLQFMARWWNGIHGSLKNCSRKGCGFEPHSGYQLMKSFWRVWAKALGEKASEDNCEADKVAFVRTMIILSYLITNGFIIAGVIRRW